MHVHVRAAAGPGSGCTAVRVTWYMIAFAYQSMQSSSSHCVFASLMSFFPSRASSTIWSCALRLRMIVSLLVSCRNPPKNTSSRR